ncbi:tyrosine-protein phosphatase [Levilactobacillus angrenensis]|uniref:Tyrosine-protein phosphatase n=1 Tax=Levilactobacillus angrenensis TaxID=2486020 RepID=A0ABW1UBK4_9LACO|nr:tyrosine-protein phosphatase [Levilactobacillus angrenensis]
MARQRVIPVTGGMNFRDLGGYTTADGRTVKWQKLFRAGHLSALTLADQQLLLNQGVTVDIDFRSTAELAQFPDRLPNGICFKHLPVFDDDETESTGTAVTLQQQYARNAQGGYQQMRHVYRRLATMAQPQQAYRQFFQYLLAQGEQEGILFHCSAGKDRTGFGAVLLLSALGVTPEQILADYLLTNDLSQARVAARIQAAKRADMNANFLQSIHDLSIVTEDYLYQALTQIVQTAGGMSAYLHDVIGLTDGEIQRLREIYLT